MKRFRSLVLLAVVLLAVFVLIMGFYYVQVSGNRTQAFNTGELLIDQIEVLLDRNREQVASLTESHKEDYITRARAVSYIIDHEPLIGADSEELKKIAKLVSVDEIYLFDVGGTIYSGTNRNYIGLNMDSGEQIGFFKPMLKDRNLSLCQDITPNTANGELMMYAMCWSETGDRLVQVGVKPQSLIDAMDENSLGRIVDGLLFSEGYTVIIANAGTGVIEGSSKAEYHKSTLEEIGIDYKNRARGEVSHWTYKNRGVHSYCTLEPYGDYVIVVSQTHSSANQNITRGLIMMTGYVLIALAIVFFIVRKLTAKIGNEHKSANTDQMTGFLNRRAYETDVLNAAKDALGQEYVYVSMDLNGLKEVNDSHGHEAGDRLIKGAAECMAKVFSKYGNIYRIGGDEFAAILYLPPFELDELKLLFKKRVKSWAEASGLPLAVSCGYVRSADNPDTDPSGIAKLADAEMYKEKEAYYSETGRDRRARKN